jgi:hypothetical protein
MSITQAWAVALDVEPSEVPYYLGRVGSLLLDVRRAAEETGTPAFAPMGGHLNALSQCIFPHDQPMNVPAANVMPSGNAMEMLAALSYALSLDPSKGAIPDDEELDELKAAVKELTDEIRDSGLPAVVKRALLHRLAEMLEALEHLEIGGPEGARRAAEALAASAVIYGEVAGDDAPSVDKIKKVARKAWAAFSVGAVLANGIIGWDRLVHPDKLLETGQSQRALPPGPLPTENEPPPAQGQPSAKP